MEISITRESYEQLRENPQPGVSIEMKCTYLKPKRISPSNRRSPLDEYRLSPKSANIALGTASAQETRDFVHNIDLPMASGELAERVATYFEVTANNASYRVGVLIKNKVLVPA